MKYEFDEFAYLYLNDELSENEKIDFENLIAEDSNLNDEFELIKKFNTKISSAKRLEVSDKLLTDARRNLRLTISEIENQESTSSNILNSISSFFTQKYSTVFSAAFSLMIGLFVGDLIFSGNQNDINNLNGFDLDQALSNDYKISNIQFLEEENSNENLTLHFEAVKPVVISGNISDPEIKKILTSAIINSDNAGLKMRSINKLAEEKNSILLNDSKIKEALITAVQSDPNPGVRKEALHSLELFNYDNQVRDAFLFVLKNDSNSGLRIIAINALSKMKLEGFSLDENIYDNLSNQIENEKSDYIKLRTTALLGESK